MLWATSRVMLWDKLLLEVRGKTPFRNEQKASRKHVGKRPPGLGLAFLRFLFNLVLILIVGTLVVVSSLYAYVLYIREDQLERKYPDLVKNSSVYDNVGHTTRLSTAVPIGYPGPASLCSTFKCLGGLR